jgi:hypothetical protein
VVEGTFKFGPSRLGVRTTSERMGRWLDEVLVEHRMTRWKDAYYSLVVAEDDAPGRRGFHVMYKGTVPVVRTSDLRTLARAFLEEIESHTFQGRRDALYLDASVIVGPGGAALIPSSFTPALGSQSRRAERLGLELPASTWVAVDPATSEVVPARSGLRIPPDALERLDGDGSRTPSDRFFVERPIRLDAVCLVNDRPTRALEPISRATALYRYASMSQNLPRVGGSLALEALGRLVSRAECVGVAPMNAGQVLESLAELTASPSGYAL